MTQETASTPIIPTPARALTTRPPSRFRSHASLAAMAAAGAIAVPAIVEAQIVYSGVLNADLASNATVTLLFQGTPTNGSELILKSGGRKKGAPTHTVLINAFGDTAVDFTPVTLGTIIDASRTYSPTGSSLGNVVGTSYYYAFTYAPEDVDLYGWIHYTLAMQGNLTTMTLNDWAYNSVAGAPITVGQTFSAIPEPAEVGTLLGVAVLAAGWLRRRQRGTARQP